MKLAEALSIRADLQKRVAQLKKRLKDCSKVQEGEELDEKAEPLYEELDQVLTQLEDLIYRINVTNLHTQHEGETLTGLIARRDILSMRASLMREDRYSHSEIRYVRMVDVPALRKCIDDYAQQLRKLDVRIQSLNWTTELE